MPDHEAFPEAFIEQVKEALEKLYDFQALQENPFAQQLNAHQPGGAQSGVHQLRGQLIDAIETLNPGQNVSAHSGTVRIYNLIYMHYVGRQTIQQAAWEVGISLRQAYRDLRRGQELVSAVLWHKLHAESLIPQQETSVHAELTRLGESTTITTLQAMLESAVRPVQILADKYGVVIQVEAPADPILLTTNPMMAQQILTHILSQIIQQVRPACLSLRLSNGICFMQMGFTGGSLANPDIKPIIQQMMDQLNWELAYSSEGGMQEIRLKTSQRSVLLMLIDDNEGLTQLLQRYLTDGPYKVLPVPNTEQGLQLIQQAQPDVIILDVMMPGMDGWELLQRLRTKGETQLIPVIICSVINDPELAYALGASQYVPKPVTREALQHALQQLQL